MENYMNNTFLTNNADLRAFNRNGRYIRTAEHKKTLDDTIKLMLEAIQSGDNFEAVRVAKVMAKLNEYNEDCELNEWVIRQIIDVIKTKTTQGDAFTSWDLAKYLRENNIYIDINDYPTHAVAIALRRLIDEGKIEKRVCRTIKGMCDTITVYIVK